MADGLNKDTLKELVSLGRSAVAVQTPGEGMTPFAVIPSDCKIEDLSRLIYNEHNSRPERIKASVSVFDPASFVEYHALFSDPNSRVFADESTQKVVAVLDYHAAGEGTPRWGHHRVTLTLRQSEQWKTWIGSNNKQFAQMAFAEFLEQNALDITKPNPAHMMDVSRDLQATTEVEFGSGSRTQDGQVRFKYTETVKATVGSGQVQVPERFTIELPAFIGGERIEMDALLRFRVKEGKLVVWYTLVRPEEVIRAAFIAARDDIAESLKIKIINGNPA